MVDTRTKDQTRAGPAPMREGGMPDGQAPAVRAPMTAVQRRDAENAKKATEAREAILQAVEASRMNIESFLSVFNVGYDLFLAGLLVFLSRQQRDQPEFFVDLDMPSFLEALTRVAMNGLIPDGKEAAIAAYKDNAKGGIKIAQPMFMRDGFVKVLWRTGLIAAINDQVVTVAEYEAGRFQYEEGDEGFVRHQPDLRRKDSDAVVAAYCVIELLNGHTMREVVPEDELMKMRKMSKSPARQAWQHQMDRKGALRRIMGKMPREKGIVQLLQHDDDTYLASPAVGQDDPEAPSHGQLFGGRPIRRKKVREPMVVPERKEPAHAVPEEPHEVSLVNHGADPHGVGATVKVTKPKGRAKKAKVVPVDEVPSFVLRAVLGRKNGLQEFDPAKPDIWYGDIRQKMQELKDEPLDAFWKINGPYIEDAGRNGFGPQAMRLLGLAEELGLIAKGDGQ